jgi:hypothetical protein
LDCKLKVSLTYFGLCYRMNHSVSRCAHVFAVLPTGNGKSLIFTLLLLARENITRINTDGRIVFLATGFITGLLHLGLLAASLSELFKAFVTTRLRSGNETVHIGN